MITSSIELTSHEKLAIALLQTHPEEFAKIAKGSPSIDLNDILSWYKQLVGHLEFAKIRRRKDYIDSDTVERKDVPA